MSQMLNSAGGTTQGAGYSGSTQDQSARLASSSSSAVSHQKSLPVTASSSSSSLGLSNSQHYGQHSSTQQQLLQHQLQQQHSHPQIQFQQTQSAQQQKVQPQHFQQPRHIAAVQGGSTGTPILGSGGSVYRQLARRNPTATASQQLVSDGSENRAVGGAIGMEAAGMGVAQGEVQAAMPSLYHEDEKENSNLANTKEKTPMCLINELARFNKVSHQYTLVDEQGPAHKKTFFVKLKLGEEEYSAQGESIKKAQHAAAAIALEDTKFSHPSPKPKRATDADINNVTPTVELNALAMKRGEAAVYKLIEPRNQNYAPLNFDYRGMYNQRYHYGRPPRPFYVMLKVGTKEFIGDGPTRQAARHNAATKALKVLRNLSMPSEGSKTKEEEEEESEDGVKSEISLVHEIALKRNLPVSFEVVRESGPPHMKTFVTKCIVGELTTEAEGHSKKLSKKRAAEQMLEELKKLPSVPVVLKTKIKPANNKKKNRNIIKVQKADPSYGVGVNPISRLIQIMQAMKKREPVYTLLAEKGLPRRREFVMQCQVDEDVTEGVGPNKKLAKRTAAENMLQLLGFNRPSPQPSKPAIKTSQSSEGSSTSDKKVTFVDTGKSSNGGSGDKGDGGNSTGCQVAPGLLRLNHTGAAMISNLRTSPTAHSFTSASEPVSAVLSKAEPQAERQASALAQHLNIPIIFEEFTNLDSRNNNCEFLTRLTLSTHPPQVFHGAGPTRDSSRDTAAVCAMKVLLGMATKPNSGAGDAGAVKTEAIAASPALARQVNGTGDQL